MQCYNKIEKNVYIYKKGENMISRNLYLNKLIENMNNGLPKVITGIRRCGKSYLLNNIFKEYLLSKGIKEKNIIYIDLLNVSNAELKDPINLNKFVLKSLKNNEKYFIFVNRTCCYRVVL